MTQEHQVRNLEEGRIVLLQAVLEKTRETSGVLGARVTAQAI